MYTHTYITYIHNIHYIHIHYVYIYIWAYWSQRAARWLDEVGALRTVGV